MARMETWRRWAALGALTGLTAACAPETRDFGTMLLDNMEDGDGFILGNAGTQGQWTTFNDGTAGAAQEPIANEMIPFKMSEPGADGSKYAAMSWGSGFTEWGAGYGFDLNNDGKVKASYDAAEKGFQGLTFKAKVGALSFESVRVALGDGNTDPLGGKCNEAATEADPNRCYDSFGKTLHLTEDWEDYVIPFSDLKQEDWGQNGVSAVDAATLYEVGFRVDKTAPSFEIWLDDIAFYR